MGQLPNLISLGLGGNKITDEGLKHLSKMPHLEILSLGKTDVTDEGLSYLVNLPLKSLGLIHCAITDAGAAHIAKLSNLEVLWLGRTRVTDLGLANFVDLPLKALGLLGTRITDAGAVDLSEISTLENLLIGMTPLTDASLADLRRLEGLKSISLPYSISADARKQLQVDRPKLIVSFWFETNIEGKSYVTLVHRLASRWTAYHGGKFASDSINPRQSDDEMVKAINVLIAATIRAQSDNPPTP